jgi:AGCS family alanine or glycine:cation symporter
MFDLIFKINSILNEFLWGPPMIVAILGVGIYLTAGTRLVQVRNFPAVLKETVIRKKRAGAQGDISPFAALNVALAGTVGVGNIAGVATAIAAGGPGAIFWMWVSGLLGMATKFSEVALGIKYRIHQTTGPMIGGPMMYISQGMGKNFKFLAGMFAVLGALAAFCSGNMVQANSVAIGLQEFNIPRFVTAILLILAVGLVTLGGLKRIAHVAMFCVPFMCIIYFLCALIIIFLNIQKLPQTLILVFQSAFTPAAATGGFLGASVRGAIRWGIARGVFSNEAGLGSAPMAHATARTDHPARQGLWGIFEVFIDTIVICSATALAILITDAWKSGSTGSLLTMSAFQTVFGKQLGFSIVVLCMVLTAYDTILAWGFYGETCSAYLFGAKARLIYRVLWLVPIILGCMGKLEAVWALADTFNGLMAIPNLIALFALGPVVFGLTKEFFKKNDSPLTSEQIPANPPMGGQKL